MSHIIVNNDYLAHHGIKGQKWGIRRYQNEDGRLTAEGRARYKVDKADAKEYTKQLKKLEKERVGLESDKIYATMNTPIKSGAFNKRIKEIKAKQSKIIDEAISRGMNVKAKEAIFTPSHRQAVNVVRALWMLTSDSSSAPAVSTASQVYVENKYRNPDDLVKYKGREIYQNPYRIVGNKYKVHV